MMLSDVVMPGKDGIALLEDIRALGSPVPVVMISGQANIEMAVRATRLGAVDFLEKPLSTDKLLLTVDNVLRLKRLEDENRQLRQRVGKHEIVLAGEAMRRVMAQVDRVAASETRVCILGETGTGKELIARALHERSPRRDGPFITLNCAAVPARADRIRTVRPRERLLHRRGGAPHRQVRAGPPRHAVSRRDRRHAAVMQAKLLRVLEEGEVERVGGDRADSGRRARGGGHASQSGGAGQAAAVSARISTIASTFSRSVLPPLRERTEDIPVLVEHFARQLADQNGWKPKPVRRRRPSPSCSAIHGRAMCANCATWWSDCCCWRTRVQVDATCGWRCRRPRPPRRIRRLHVTGTLVERVESFEREVMLAELKRHNHHMTETAKALGLERSHLYKKCQQLGIDLRALRKGEGN